MTLDSFLWIALFAWLVRKAYKWVKLRNEQIDYENAVIAGLREDIEAGRIKWPRS